MSAQASQALASFALQILAARLLGLEGLGRFATAYALIVLATAVVTGFVGDSLTVLDRQHPRVRAGLQVWWLGLSLLTGVSIGLGVGLSGFVDPASAVVVGVATTVFVLEDTLRRLLMANLAFWRIVLVDLAGLLVAVGVLLAAVGTVDEVGLVHFFGALAAAQTVALAVAVALLPSAERRLVSLRGADLRTVAAYGSWRSLQLSIKPALLAAVRVLGVAVVSAAAIGDLEAARIYLSPAMIMITGLTSVLFAGYAASRGTSLRTLLHQGDRAVSRLVLAVAVLTIIALVAQPWAGPLITGGDYDLSTVAILGWAAFAAASAATSPYSALAGVRGRQSVVVTVRLVESIASLLVVSALLLSGASIVWTPLVLAAGVLGGGAVLRIVVLGRMPMGPPEPREGHPDAAS
ncbi:MAG: hypothetical protein WA962_04295 [Ornithinimicrobium sp.]